MPLSASASPYHLPAVSLNVPSVPSDFFHEDLVHRFSHLSAQVKMLGVCRQSCQQCSWTRARVNRYRSFRSDTQAHHQMFP